MGHSFGGRVAIIYASCKTSNKLVLFASPFENKHMERSLRVRCLKLMKKVPIINKLENIAKKFIGSTDYRQASPLMRSILVNVINLDLTTYACKINCPTLLIWGSNDQEVPLNEGKKLESIIKDSGLIIYEGLGHYAYLENLGQTINILNNFLEKDKEK